ncbi:MAG: CRISPR-associated endonuclease Cas2 [Myxococcales bacterium]|nr:MAG: CRISPR-associated endonuclease Cas2 [Myxococcales bacterium]
MTATFLWVVVYEVKDPARQEQVRNLLRFAGRRVQDCIYEVSATAARMRQLQDELSLHLDPEDGVRIYRVCADCRGAAVLFGEGELLGRPAALVI